jgi:hypothetical protein
MDDDPRATVMCGAQGATHLSGVGSYEFAIPATLLLNRFYTANSPRWDS